MVSTTVTFTVTLNRHPNIGPAHGVESRVFGGREQRLSYSAAKRRAGQQAGVWLMESTTARVIVTVEREGIGLVSQFIFFSDLTSYA